MKNKSKNFIIPLVIYPFDIMVSFGETDEQILKRWSHYNLSEIDKNGLIMSDTVIGRFHMMECNASVIRFKHMPETCFDYGILAHEIFHAVTHIMNKVGLKFKIFSNDEAYAYLMGYVTTEIYKKL
jgi:hypothetical protein